MDIKIDFGVVKQRGHMTMIDHERLKQVVNKELMEKIYEIAQAIRDDIKKVFWIVEILSESCQS